jgi:ABC-type lipoprotein export system ATPase subunit
MSAEATERVVQCVGVQRTYRTGETEVHVLRGLNLEIEKGTLVALYGPSGSGKTTLLNLIGMLDTPTAGTIHVMGEDVVHLSEEARAGLRRRKIGFVFQSYALLPTHTALENIDLTLRLPGLSHRERQRRTREVLEAVGLSAWANHVPDELSGGQRQRIAIARALALQPQLMLADEPTAGLDIRMARGVMGLFREIAQSRGTTFVIVSRDPMINEYVDTAYDLNEGRLTPRLKDIMREQDTGATLNGEPKPAADSDSDTGAGVEHDRAGGL